MYLVKIKTKNYKLFGESFEVSFNKNLNILVGDNHSGKSTVLEAINLVLRGSLDGQYLSTEKINEYLLNLNVKKDFLNEISAGKKPVPPEIIIELHFSEDASSDFEGTETIDQVKAKGVYTRISIRDEYLPSYNKLSKDELKSLPLEFYDIETKTFAGKDFVRMTSPIKSYLIDVTNNFQNASDIAISRIIKNKLEDDHKLLASQFHRNIKDSYKKQSINTEISKHLTYPNSEISIDPSHNNSWDSHLSVYIDEIPLSYSGKGNQVLLKTNVLLYNNKSDESSIILVEEPENHLSHSNLNKLVSEIQNKCIDKQIIITSHSSFVANKLNLGNLILLNKNNLVYFNKLNETSSKKDTEDFFEKLPGYDTLRVVLAKAVILVEGDADELCVQKFYKNKTGKLPIEDGVEIISVNNSYRRFLDILDPLKFKVAVILDSDDRSISLNKEVGEFVGKQDNKIKFFFEENDVELEYLYTNKDQKTIILNKNTLEPLILKYNTKDKLSILLGENFNTDLETVRYMIENKTKTALKIFTDETSSITAPKYIENAIDYIIDQNGPKE